MTFKLKSGNTTSFKLMGGTDKSPAKHRLTRRVPNKVDFDRLPKSYPKDHAVEVKHEHPKDEKKGDSIKTEQGVIVSDKKESPAKQRVSDLPKNFNIKGSKGSATPGYSTTKAAKTQNFRNAANKIKTVSSKTNKGSKVIQAFKNTPKQLSKGGKEFLKKGARFLGGKTLGVLGMMMATSSKADQPKGKKSEGEQIKALLTKHKLKGGKK